jgi:3-deoxy-D-arabino-heptulosonate 7-phosphate (DAHP) synthase
MAHNSAEISARQTQANLMRNVRDELLLVIKPAVDKGDTDVIVRYAEKLKKEADELSKV